MASNLSSSVGCMHTIGLTWNGDLYVVFKTLSKPLLETSYGKLLGHHRTECIQTSQRHALQNGKWPWLTLNFGWGPRSENNKRLTHWSSNADLVEWLGGQSLFNQYGKDSANWYNLEHKIMKQFYITVVFTWLIILWYKNQIMIL